jgi:hypothetical protein
MEEKMDSKKSDGNARENFLTWKLEIPTWLLTVIVIALTAAVAQTRMSPFILIAIVIAFIVIGVLQTWRRPVSKQNEIILSDEDAPDHKITLSSIPPDVTPTLLKIEDRERSKNYDKDGVGEILFIAGDLVFYKNGKEVNNFSSPIKLTYNYTEKDEAKLMARANSLLERKEVTSIEEVKFIPVYLYSNTQKPELKTWKPFQNYSIDYVNRTVTIEFMFWGDQQAGGGTRP